MPWSSSDRRARLPRNWGALTRAVHARSAGRCEAVSARTGQRCPNPADGGVDHRDRGGPDAMWNLQDLCRAHHATKTTAEAAAAKRVRAARTGKPHEAHPGSAEFADPASWGVM